ncbi:MAG: exosortase/archaeosortase family protein [Chitinophagales bacterium]|nr:exosortase/archaeosortase family protein [Chitinophagales bacterium]MDW8418768.1 hypothetical protein [Chitinophagales bacterium]
MVVPTVNGNLIKRIKELWNDRGNRFVIQVVGIYLCWKLLYYIIENDKGIVRIFWLKLVKGMGVLYAEITHRLLLMMSVPNERIAHAVKHTESQKAITIDEHCLAIPAMFIFSACIAVFSGSWRNKIWFIPLGVLGIAGINIARVTVLAFVHFYLPDIYFIFHHSFAFIIITYSLVFLLIRFWMKYLSVVE